MLLAIQLMIGREEVGLPGRWRNLRLEGDRRLRFTARLIKRIRWLERLAAAARTPSCSATESAT